MYNFSKFLSASLLSLACTGLLTLALHDTAHAEPKVTRFAKAGNWRIIAVHNANRTFSHCAAQAKYKSGMEVFLIAYGSGNWSLQFFRRDWPQRKAARFPATLKVDGRTVLKTQGRFRGRSAFVDLGASAKRVRAIMRGKVMAVVSPSGTSRFKLTGTMRAAPMVARCWTKYNKVNTARNDRRRSTPAEPRRRNDGAFGTAPESKNDGAFAAQPPRREPQRRNTRLSRQATMDFALRYLSGTRKSYQILPSERNVLKNFPINWQYSNGQLGGMMVLQSSRLNAISGLDSLIRDQNKWCRGNSRVERRPTKGLRGSRIAGARGTCSMERGKRVVYDYSVAELSNRRVVLVIEALSTAQRRNSGRPVGAGADRNEDRRNRAPESSDRGKFQDNKTDREAGDRVETAPSFRRPGPDEL